MAEPSETGPRSAKEPDERVRPRRPEGDQVPGPASRAGRAAGSRRSLRHRLKGDPDAGPHRLRPGRSTSSEDTRGLRLAAGGVLMAALVVALIVTSVRLANRDGVESSRSGALAAARTYAVAVASYDYRNLARDLGTVLQHSAPSFKQQFETTSRALEPSYLQYQGMATADVTEAGVIDSSPSQATVMLFVDQTVVNSRLARPKVNHDRMVMRLTHPGDQWLISQVSLL